MEWAGHAACMGQIRNAYNILDGKSKRKRPHTRIILKWTLKKWYERVWSGFIWLRIETVCSAVTNLWVDACPALVTSVFVMRVYFRENLLRSI